MDIDSLRKVVSALDVLVVRGGSTTPPEAGRKGGGEMEQSRSNGLILFVVGATVALVCTFADELGLGTPGSGFGWAQGLGTFVGSLGIIAGSYLSGFEGRYLAAAGIAVVILFLAWDKIGLGRPGFGCAHSIALFTGAAVAGIGFYLMKKGS